MGVIDFEDRQEQQHGNTGRNVNTLLQCRYDIIKEGQCQIHGQKGILGLQVKLK